MLWDKVARPDRLADTEREILKLNDGENFHENNEEVVPAREGQSENFIIKPWE